jgi:antitoxin HigA-1
MKNPFSRDPQGSGGLATRTESTRARLLAVLTGLRMMRKKLDLILPGEILWKEFMEPLGLSQNKLARDIDVPVTRISDIIHGRRGITADSALRLSVYFGTTAEFWLNLQTRYELKVSRRDILPQIEQTVRPFAGDGAMISH